MLVPKLRVHTNLIVLGCLLALVLNAAIQLHTLWRPFDAERFASGSAHFATIARTYAREGFFTYRGLPIGNNAPQGTELDAYIHWPPLFNYLLGIVFKIFGASESAGRSLVILIACLIGAMVYRLTRINSEVLAGRASLLCLMTVPAFVEFTRLVQPTTLCILFYLLSLFAFAKTVENRTETKWFLFSCISIILAVATSWEAVLMPPGLVVTALLLKDKQQLRRALVLMGVTGVTAVLVLTYYAVAQPSLVGDLWHTVCYRMRLSSSYATHSVLGIHSIVNRNYYQQSPGVTALIKAFLSDFWGDLGFVPLVSIIVAFLVVVKSRGEVDSRRFAYIFLALGAPVVLWYGLMPIQARYNEFELLMAAPWAACSFGFVVSRSFSYFEVLKRGGFLKVATAILLVGVSLFPLVHFLRKVWKAPASSGLVEYSEKIRSLTPSGAVILSPETSVATTFYSDRHIVRGIWSDGDVDEVEKGVSHIFPESSVYLALPPAQAADFPITLSKARPVYSDSRLLLVSLK